MSEGLFHPHPRLAVEIPLSLLERLSRSRVSSLSISTVVDVSVETEDPTTPPANHATTTLLTPPPSPCSSEKQSESRLRRNHRASCRRRLSPLDKGADFSISGLLHINLNIPDNSTLDSDTF